MKKIKKPEKFRDILLRSIEEDDYKTFYHLYMDSVMMFPLEDDDATLMVVALFNDTLFTRIEQWQERDLCLETTIRLIRNALMRSRTDIQKNAKPPIKYLKLKIFSAVVAYIGIGMLLAVYAPVIFWIGLICFGYYNFMKSTGKIAVVWFALSGLYIACLAKLVFL